MHTGVKIVQNRHQLYTAEVKKVSLSPFNDKKWITREGKTFISHSFGNNCISQIIVIVLYFSKFE